MLKINEVLEKVDKTVQNILFWNVFCIKIKSVNGVLPGLLPFLLGRWRMKYIIVSTSMTPTVHPVTMATTFIGFSESSRISGKSVKENPLLHLLLKL